VMLSTRSNGYTYPMYPLLGRYNYVISSLLIKDKTYLLDASQPRLGFGHLSYDCYNGPAVTIDEWATPVALVADSLKESKLSFVVIVNDKGNLSGSMRQDAGYNESYLLRNRIKDKGKEQYFSDIKKSFNADIELTEPAIDSLDRYDLPVTVRYNFTIKPDNEDIIYFNPLLGEAWKENPFKSAERKYPIEMPYTIDESYILQLEVPEGYTVDELPKQIKMKLNEEGDGAFEYLVSHSNGTVMLRCRLQLKRAYYDAEEYDYLREFFNQVVKKESEQIVFKKKS